MTAKMEKHAPILITGAAGMLGLAVTKLFAQRGFHNLLTPSKSELNLLDREIVSAFFSRYKPRAVVHLASLVFGLGGNLRNQMRSAIDNTAINTNLFSAINAHPVEYVFFAGTVASYPHPYKNIPLKEDEFFNGLPHCGEFGYAMAKRHAYSFMEILARETGLRYSYGILTNLYGPHDRFDVKNGHVIPSLIAKAHAATESGLPLEIWGNGSAVRDFLYVDDAARAIYTCFESDDSELINISSGSGFSILDISNLIAATARIESISFSPDAPVGISNRIVNNQKLKKLGFEPLVSIEEGLARTYNWYKMNLGIARR